MMNIRVMGWQHRAYMVFLDGYLYAILWNFSFWFDTNFCMGCKRNLRSRKCPLSSLDFDSQDYIYYFWLSNIIKSLRVCNLISILIFAYFLTWVCCRKGMNSLLDRCLNPPQVTIHHGFLFVSTNYKFVLPHIFFYWSYYDSNMQTWSFDNFLNTIWHT